MMQGWLKVALRLVLGALWQVVDKPFDQGVTTFCKVTAM